MSRKQTSGLVFLDTLAEFTSQAQEGNKTIPKTTEATKETYEDNQGRMQKMKDKLRPVAFQRPFRRNRARGYDMLTLDVDRCALLHKCRYHGHHLTHNVRRLHRVRYQAFLRCILRLLCNQGIAEKPDAV